MEKKEETSVVKKLPKRFGLEPKYYLTIYYALIILVVFILISFGPSFCSNKALVSFDKSTVPMAIYNNDRYIGSTLDDIALAKGDYNLTIKVLDYDISSINAKIRPRRFFSYIGETTYSLNYKYNLSDYIQNDLIEYMIDLTARQSLVIDYGNTRYYQPILTQVANTFVKSDSNTSLLLESLNKVGPLVSSKEIYDDLKNAYEILGKTIPKNIKETTTNVFRVNDKNNNLITITKVDYALFLAKNFKYQIGVVNENIADEFYLSNYDDISSDDLMTSISYNMADLYSKYLSKKTGKTYRVATLEDLQDNMLDTKLNIGTSSDYVSQMNLLNLSTKINELSYPKAVVNCYSSDVGLLAANECSLTTTYVLTLVK